MIASSLEERRRGIAIRKVHGATARDILAAHAREYFLLLLAAVLVALPLSHVIMQRWMEQYTRQAGIPAWIYPGILLLLALVIVSSIGWRVWQASRENPAGVLKSG